MSRKMKPPEPRQFSWFWVIVLVSAAIIIWLSFGCSHLTVAPKPINPTQIAFSGNHQNAGVVDCDKDGCIVEPGWLDKYHELEKTFKSYVFADKDIKPEGENYRVSYQVQNHFAELRAAERGP